MVSRDGGLRLERPWSCLNLALEELDLGLSLEFLFRLYQCLKVNVVSCLRHRQAMLEALCFHVVGPCVGASVRDVVSTIYLWYATVDFYTKLLSVVHFERQMKVWGDKLVT